MNVHILLTTRFLKLEIPAGTFCDLPHFRLTGSQEYKNTFFLDAEGVEELGRHMVHNPMSQYAYGVVYHPLPNIKEEDTRDEKLLAVGNHTSQVSRFFNNLLALLWFIKDNSVCGDFVYARPENESSAVGNLIILNQSSDFTASGILEVTTFRLEDLERIYNIAKKIKEVCPSSKDQTTNGPEKPGEIYETSKQLVVTSFDYVSYNRIEKALLFLSSARKEYHLLPKIANYCSILECLFGIENTELSYRISQRVALYLGTTYEECIDYKKTVSKAYDIRSRYLHGHIPKEDRKNFQHEKLVELSVSIDEVIRRALNKIIMEDSSVFVDETKLADFFTRLVYDRS